MCRDESFDYLLGPALLVACVLEPDVRERSVYLPHGTRWCEWRTGRWHVGGTTISVPAPLDALPPLLIRANTCVPFGPDVRRSTSDASANAERTLRLYPSPEGGDYESVVLEDSGDGPATAGHGVVVVHVWADAAAVRVHVHLRGAPLAYKDVVCCLPPQDARKLTDREGKGQPWLDADGCPCLQVPVLPCVADS